jgi:DNA-binding transcriptional MerR regulator
MEDPRWNLDELAERVDAALAVGYRGQPSGRVRAVPDRRAIRWYTTIGLIDRPVAYRGRTALYGPRHLLQLVAVKRLQAKGLPLVTIQQELAGATDTQLARVAHLPAGTVPAAAPAPAVAPGGSQAAGALVPDGERSRTGAGTASERTAARTAAGVPRVARAAAARRAGFWRQPPAPAMAAIAEGTDQALGADPGAPADPVHPSASAGDGIATLQGIRLGEGATLLLEPGRELDAADVQAILDAAGPLLSALRDREFAGGPRDPNPGPNPNPGPANRFPNPTPPRAATPPRAPARRKGGNEPRREQP